MHGGMVAKGEFTGCDAKNKCRSFTPLRFVLDDNFRWSGPPGRLADDLGTTGGSTRQLPGLRQTGNDRATRLASNATIIVQMALSTHGRFLLLGFTTALAANQLAAENAAPSTFGQAVTQSSLSTQRSCNLSLKVMDQSGAWVPRAHVTVVEVALDGISEKDTDASGHAEFLLPRCAQYKATVAAPGFNVYAETFKLESDTAKMVTLIVESSGSPIVIYSYTGPEPTPVDYPLSAVEIPQQPLVLLPLPSRAILHSHR